MKINTTISKDERHARFIATHRDWYTFDKPVFTELQLLKKEQQSVLRKERNKKRNSKNRNLKSRLTRLLTKQESVSNVISKLKISRTTYIKYIHMFNLTDLHYSYNRRKVDWEA